MTTPDQSRAELQRLIAEAGDAIAAAAPAAPAAGEVWLFKSLLAVGGGCGGGLKLSPDQCQRLVALLEQLSAAALHPVPVSERPWEREGWCDSEGRCWWWNPPIGALGTGWWGLQPWEWMVDATVCLPAHALPHPTTTPAGQEGTDDSSHD